jgi:hypothetical protein
MKIMHCREPEEEALFLSGYTPERYNDRLIREVV